MSRDSRLDHYQKQEYGSFARLISEACYNKIMLIQGKSRATLEGIAFALIYGIEILKNDGVVIESLKVGNDNLFLSDVFSKTIANTLGITIKMLEATGADGAAKAGITGERGGLNNDTIQITKTIDPNPKSQNQSIESFRNWKEQLLHNII